MGFGLWGSGVWVYLDPKEPTYLSKDLYMEIIIRSSKKERFFGVQVGFRDWVLDNGCIGTFHKAGSAFSFQCSGFSFFFKGPFLLHQASEPILGLGFRGSLIVQSRLRMPAKRHMKPLTRA